jgi:CRP-like cAMP-binding protein
VQEGWRIETGFVRTLSYLEDGTLVPLGVWGPGDTVGLPRLGTPQQVECLTKVSALLAAIADDRQVNEILLAHLQQAQELMLIRSHPRIELMLIKLLGWLGRRFGRTVDRGQLLELRLTHQDIAELLGATRVTITRTLHQLEQQGLIERLSLRQILLHEWETWHYEI